MLNVGDKLICKNNYCNKDGDIIYRNYEYKISSIDLRYGYNYYVIKIESDTYHFLHKKYHEFFMKNKETLYNIFYTNKELRKIKLERLKSV